MNSWDAIGMLWQIVDTYEPGSMTRKAIMMGIDALLNKEDSRRGEKQQKSFCITCVLGGIVIGIMFMMVLDIIGIK